METGNIVNRPFWCYVARVELPYGRYAVQVFEAEHDAVQWLCSVHGVDMDDENDAERVEMLEHDINKCPFVQSMVRGVM